MIPSGPARTADPALPPRRPVVAVIAVLVHDRQVLLVRRRHPPDQGLWGFPGGKVELGETVAAAAVRELAEETGIQAAAGAVLTALDVIGPAGEPVTGPAAFHYVLIAIRCHWQAGIAAAADDAEAVAWFDATALTALGSAASRDVARIGLAALADG